MGILRRFFEDKQSSAKALTPKEIQFLKYIDGKSPEGVALYWLNDDEIDVKALVSEFLSRGYANENSKGELYLTEDGHALADPVPLSLMRDHVKEKERVNQIVQELQGTPVVQFLDNEQNNYVFIALLMLSHELGLALPSKKYIDSWIPGFYKKSNDDKIKAAIAMAQEKHCNDEYRRARLEFSNALFDEALVGYAYELCGKIDKAIIVYENVISKGFYAKKPFDRLAAYYKKYKASDALERIEAAKEAILMQ